ncbi:MAG: hypothetical protein UT34_C0001G0297 [candidate division WS6 bacterium GW2011_GWF2_39_15]|uniref:Uncharacterized protein n=1 Tax=candidate division WS6 bacterium GW2011_GWF2_39_15 TaxID=1619100 RepID=A0A0G0QXB3_9BACT|nr:MAG: hypothetical protein UT34_C0001G0297 [candidate division WS6 bacterium GW2011_GWF2_39_15]
MDDNTCPICGFKKIEKQGMPKNDTTLITCPVCGEYVITYEAQHYEDVKDKIRENGWALSGLIRYSTDRGLERIVVRTDNIDDLLHNAIIPNADDIERKARYLQNEIRRRTHYFGESVSLNYSTNSSLAFARKGREFEALLNLLEESGIVEVGEQTLGGGFSIKLTAKGYSIDESDVLSHQVFIANWFAEEQEEVIKAVEEAVRNCGYEPMCIKDKKYPDTIMEKALGEIRKSKFVIINLTGMRPAVVYEAGFAGGIGKEFFYVQHESEKEDNKKKSFYTGHYQIQYYKDLDQLKEIVISTITARFPH